MTIKPTSASERSPGCFTIRVEGEDVERCREAHAAGYTVDVDQPAGTYRIVGQSVVGNAGFFDVEAVEAGPVKATDRRPLPDAPEIMDPAIPKPRRSRDSSR